jgi:hypothetical protein
LGLLVLFLGAAPVFGTRAAPEPLDDVASEELVLFVLGVARFPPDVDLALPLEPLLRALPGVGFDVERVDPPVLLRPEALGPVFDEAGGLTFDISRSDLSALEPAGPFGGMALELGVDAGGGPATIPLRNSTSCVAMRIALEKTK